MPPVSLGSFGAGFAFESTAWQQANVRTIELRTIVRQSGDMAFIRLLTPVRIGLCSPETTEALAACHVDVKPSPQDGILPTKLVRAVRHPQAVLELPTAPPAQEHHILHPLPRSQYCTNVNVDGENSTRLASLPGQPTSFHALDSFKGDYAADAKMKLCELVEKKAVSCLQLKVGAQCILTKNMPELRLVNGSRGVVVGFEETWCDSYGVPAGQYQTPVVKFDSGQRLAIQPSSFFQGGPGGAVVRIALPLKLAWALTVRARHRA